MDKKEFCKKILKEVKKMVAGDKNVKIKVFHKGEAELAGLIITDQKEEVHTSPIIYLENFYDENIQESEIPNVASEIIEFYVECLKNMSVQFPAYIYDYVAIKPHLFIRFASAECVKETEAISVDFFDFKLAVAIEIMDGEEIFGSALASIKFLQIWNMKEEDVFRAAVENTMKKYEAVVADPIRKKDGAEPECKKNPDAFCLTNNQYFFGSAVIAYPGMLHSLHEQIGDFLMFPVSLRMTFIVRKEQWKYPYIAIRKMLAENTPSDELLTRHGYLVLANGRAEEFIEGAE